jgi:hypothetical protein
VPFAEVTDARRERIAATLYGYSRARVAMKPTGYPKDDRSEGGSGTFRGKVVDQEGDSPPRHLEAELRIQRGRLSRR